MAEQHIVIVGGGISGLATAHHVLRLADEGKVAVKLTLIEASNRLGGKIETLQTDGFTLEYGPNGFLDNRPDTLELVERVGQNDALLPASQAAKKRYLYADGELQRLPESPGAFWQSRLLTGTGKLRLFAEPVVTGLRAEDQSLADFAERRLGKEALDRLIGPMVSGIYAGDPWKLSLPATFKKLHDLEQQHGSLVVGLVKEMLEKRRAAQSSSPPQPNRKMGHLTSFKDGMEALPKGIQRRLEADDRATILRETSVDTVYQTDDGFKLNLLGEGEQILCDKLISAVPAEQLARFGRYLLPEATEHLEEIPYSPVTVVGLGFPRDRFPNPLDGFGYLVAADQPQVVLGCLWPSSIFPEHRAPKGQVLLRIMVGGARFPELTELPDHLLRRRVLANLASSFGSRLPSPTWSWVYRWPRAIPQYTLGHKRRLAALKHDVQKVPGLFVTGNAFEGVSLNDCISNGKQVAERVVSSMLTRG